MNIFKQSYKTVRKNSDTIYKGFGFKHHSDATQYYIHPDNESYKGTTTLCQPIGEALSLFVQFVNSVDSQNSATPTNDYFTSEDEKTTFIQLAVPADWRENNIVNPKIHAYNAHFDGDNLTIAAYAENGKFIDEDWEKNADFYAMLPCFCVLLARECSTNADFSAMLLEYAESPTVDIFVNLHEDFYQSHKFDEHSLKYADLSNFDTTNMTSFRENFRIISENKNIANIEMFSEIIPFGEGEFNAEYLPLIPQLSEELPQIVQSICTPITAGDVLSILFYGPAGTGKTMSCKLACQAIKLPILEIINCTENLDEFVLGKFLPQEDKIIFRESYVTKAIREGGAVVFEEINFAKPQYLAFLNSLLDDNGFVRLDNGEIVRRHRDFRFFATMNLGYFGTKELNQALYNRFNVVVELDALADDFIIKMLTTRVPQCADKVEKMLGVYRKIKKKIESEELDFVISPRNLENWARLAKYEGYVKAAEKTIVPIAKSDRIMENTIRGIIILYKWG
ncbi:MAG: AAA family ATPase [Firmicutes bacterium]|nr:AAA family ATPase [Bacillota bacterium]